MATADNPSGKKIRYVAKHAYLDGKPRVIVFGHSMPKRLFRHFDLDLLPYDTLYRYGEITEGQAYANYLGVNHLFGEFEFVHCSGVFNENCYRKSCAVRDENPEAVLIHISSNDLSGECVSEYTVASCLLGMVESILKSSVKLVIIVSELKRADEMAIGGRL